VTASPGPAGRFAVGGPGHDPRRHAGLKRVELQPEEAADGERKGTGRAYEDPAQGDGTRVLVDRIWPRGLTRARAALDEWCTEIAPSTELRKWYGHDPERFEEFGRRYQVELNEPERAGALVHLREPASGLGVLPVLYRRGPGRRLARVSWRRGKA
jgi:uncharacterized protein YeaO (DUF488 family)